MKEQLQRIIDNMQAEIDDQHAAERKSYFDYQFHQLQGRISALEDYIQDLQQLMQQMS